jgi:hypothetical protein
MKNGKLFFLKSCWHFLAIFMGWVLLFLFTTCSRGTYTSLHSPQKDGKYDSEFPATSCSSQLENILQSVKKVNCYVTYRTFVFSDQSRITLNDLNNDQLLFKAEASLSTNEATSGTALIIYSDPNRIALLTCAHIISLPDTIISWSEYSDLGTNRFIHSISIKKKEQITVREIPEGTQFSIVACDQKKDLAILGHEYSNPPVSSIQPVFPYPAGHSNELRWGCFIYLAGYPAGQLMITKGIVSKANDNENNFLTDAPFNEGFSGGIALALRDGVPNFELVGIGRSVTASTEYFLKPEKENYEYTYNPSIPYQGPLYVKQKKDINYGVTWIVPIDCIRDFYLGNRLKIEAYGYPLDAFFGTGR